MHVISTESDGGVARISVFIKAGSRYEDSSNLGITHVLQNAAFLVSSGKTFLAIKELPSFCCCNGDIFMLFLWLFCSMIFIKHFKLKQFPVPIIEPPLFL